MSIAEFFKHDFSKGDFKLYDENGKAIFWEDSNKYGVRYERNENGLITFWEDSEKFWKRIEYNENGNETFWIDSDGDTWGIPKNKEIEMTVEELQDLVSKQQGTSINLKIINKNN